MTPILIAARTIATDHGIDPDEVTEVPGGVANHVFLLGSTLILRIPRSTAFVADLQKEVAVIPVARGAGVRTPAIVAQGTLAVDATARTPYLLMERVQGHDLVTTPGAALWDELGREVALLHRIQQGSSTAGPGFQARSAPSALGAEPRQATTPQPGSGRGSPGPAVADSYSGSTSSFGAGTGSSSGLSAGSGSGSGSSSGSTDRQVAIPEDSGAEGSSAHKLVERGYLDPKTGRWLGSWMDELRDRFDDDSPRVLLHGDLAPQNLMVDGTGRFVALIDWGDAAWGPRGMEFAKLRLEDVVRVLPTYQDVADVRFEPGELEAAVLWFHLQWGLSNLTGPPRLGERHWTAQPASRALGVLRFLVSDPPEPWGALMNRRSWGTHW